MFDLLRQQGPHAFVEGTAKYPSQQFGWNVVYALKRYLRVHIRSRHDATTAGTIAP
jgi:hypothetical protein